MNVRMISGDDARELLRADPAAILVCAYDNREEFCMYDLGGAVFLGDFLDRINSIPKSESVIFYCACPHDETAIEQAEKCQRQGFLNVHVLAGGVDAWNAAGYTLEGAGI